MDGEGHGPLLLFSWELESVLLKLSYFVAFVFIMVILSGTLDTQVLCLEYTLLMSAWFGMYC